MEDEDIDSISKLQGESVDNVSCPEQSSDKRVVDSLIKSETEKNETEVSPCLQFEKPSNEYSFEPLTKNEIDANLKDEVAKEVSTGLPAVEIIKKNIKETITEIEDKKIEADEMIQEVPIFVSPQEIGDNDKVITEIEEKTNLNNITEDSTILSPNEVCEKDKIKYLSDVIEKIETNRIVSEDSRYVPLEESSDVNMTDSVNEKEPQKSEESRCSQEVSATFLAEEACDKHVSDVIEEEVTVNKTEKDKVINDISTLLPSEENCDVKIPVIASVTEKVEGEKIINENSVLPVEETCDVKICESVTEKESGKSVIHELVNEVSISISSKEICEKTEVGSDTHKEEDKLKTNYDNSLLHKDILEANVIEFVTEKENNKSETDKKVKENLMLSHDDISDKNITQSITKIEVEKSTINDCKVPSIKEFSYKSPAVEINNLNILNTILETKTKTTETNEVSIEVACLPSSESSNKNAIESVTELEMKENKPVKDVSCFSLVEIVDKTVIEPLKETERNLENVTEKFVGKDNKMDCDIISESMNLEDEESNAFESCNYSVAKPRPADVDVPDTSENSNVSLSKDRTLCNESNFDSGVTSPQKINGNINVSVSDQSDDIVEDIKNKKIKSSQQTIEPSSLKKRKMHNFSESSEEETDEESSDSSLEFKGFKRRKVLEAERERLRLIEHSELADYKDYIIKKTFSPVIDLNEDEDRIVREVSKQKKNEDNEVDENISDVPGQISINVSQGESKNSKTIEISEDITIPIAEVSRPKSVRTSNEPKSSGIKPKIELRRSARNIIVKKKTNELQLSEDIVEEPKTGDQLTEYAQYLGLQPTVKFKCGRCGEKNFQTMASLNDHQKECNVTGSNELINSAKPVGDSSASTNFRITRKVFLCSACGTYYEKWKLFLHMRDVHKRHICLFCLGMFSFAEKLAEHLLSNHSVHEKTCKSPEEFLNLFKGSCYLTCCSCERMFTEREDFFDHRCNEPLSAASTTNRDSFSNDLIQKCNVCGIKCGHYLTCPNYTNNKFQNKSPPSSTSTKNNDSTPSFTNTNLIKLAPNITVNPKDKNEHNIVLPLNTKVVSSNKEEAYHVSNATSFCQVNIDTNSEVKNDQPKNIQTNVISDRALRYNNRKKSPSNVSDANSLIPNLVKSNKIINNSDKNVPSKDKTKDLLCDRLVVKEVGDNNQIPFLDVNNPSIIKNTESLNDVKNDSLLKKTDVVSISSDEEILGVSSDEEILAVSSEELQSKECLSNKINTIIKSKCFVKLTKLNDEPVNDSVNENSYLEIDDNSVNNASPDSSYLKNTNDLSGENNIANFNQITNSANNDSSKSDHETLELNLSKNEDSNDSALDDSDSYKHNIISDLDKKCTDQESHTLLENGFQLIENDNLLDKAEESDGSDKLSVVLSDGNSEDDKGDETNNLNSSENNNSKSEGNIKNSNHLPNGNDDFYTSGKVESLNESSKSDDNTFKIDGEKYQLASEEITAMALTLDDKIDSLSSQSVVKECIRTSCSTCIYCSHAVTIGVNGKQLALHLLAEHRYMPIKNETINDVIERLKRSLDELKDIWFNTDSYDSSDISCFAAYDRTYHCFQCNFVTNLHRDLYSHMRRVHQKTILYCCLCKANFNSYSEILCHMCPGVYVSKEINYRCCFCSVDKIPSAFRLMVHLRKTHHTCDICLEVTTDQQKLATHMWKHKLNHLCYRCGISYRNKPDITKHLFWKHGTESILCKKCLQKKWSHVYHFCIPPTAFICEECNISFSKAVALKVHKRLHTGDSPYGCSICELKFISKKLLAKHEKSHQVSESYMTNDSKENEDSLNVSNQSSNKVTDTSMDLAVSNDKLQSDTDITPVKQHKKKSKKDKDKKPKPVVDVYDLPPLNLSSESDDSDEEKELKSSKPSSDNIDENEHKVNSSSNLVNNLNSISKEGTESSETNTAPNYPEKSNNTTLNNDLPTVSNDDLVMDTDEIAQPVTIVDGIWDNFHSYKAEQEKRENLDKKPELINLENVEPIDALGDHTYCLSNNSIPPTSESNLESDLTNQEHSTSIDHDYCTNNETNNKSGSLTPINENKTTETHLKKKLKSPKKKERKQHNSSSSSSSSSDSDSSSCSCGSNCSCSSSSSNSSSSSSSDSDSSSSEQHNAIGNKHERKKDKIKSKSKEENSIEVYPVETEEPPDTNTKIPIEPEELVIKESDLETDETSTDEEFYDQCPQRIEDHSLLEKRNQLHLLGAVAASLNNGTITSVITPPVTPVPEMFMTPVTPSQDFSDPVTPSQHFSDPVTPIVDLPLETNHDSNNSLDTQITSTPAKTQSGRRKGKSKKRRKFSKHINHSLPKQQLSMETSTPSTSFTADHETENQFNNLCYPAVTPNRNAVENSITMSNQQNNSSVLKSNSLKRHSKRIPVRNKFYGYSSDEEEEKVNHPPPPPKWRKNSTVALVDANHHQQQFTPPPVQYQKKPVNHQFKIEPPEYTYSPTIVQQPTVRYYNSDQKVVNNKITLKRTITSDSNDSSEVESDSELERTILPVLPPVHPVAVPHVEKDDKVYCYCQCPYDEVSEMIACDGVNCAIEWFHFECVGIMVPPKGKWYCPDCRKRRGLL